MSCYKITENIAFRDVCVLYRYKVCILISISIYVSRLGPCLLSQESGPELSNCLCGAGNVHALISSKAIVQWCCAMPWRWRWSVTLAGRFCPGSFYIILNKSAFCRHYYYLPFLSCVLGSGFLTLWWTLSHGCPLISSGLWLSPSSFLFDRQVKQMQIKIRNIIALDFKLL